MERTRSRASHGFAPDYRSDRCHSAALGSGEEFGDSCLRLVLGLVLLAVYHVQRDRDCGAVAVAAYFRCWAVACEPEDAVAPACPVAEHLVIGGTEIVFLEENCRN